MFKYKTAQGLVKKQVFVLEKGRKEEFGELDYWGPVMFKNPFVTESLDSIVNVVLSGANMNDGIIFKDTESLNSASHDDILTWMDYGPASSLEKVIITEKLWIPFIKGIAGENQEIKVKEVLRRCIIFTIPSNTQ